MANPIKVRRGLEADRLSYMPLEGEFLYTTDEKKLYIGDGTTAGGNPIVGGIGDVVGPASSVANYLVLFDGITGKLIKQAVSAFINSSGGLDVQSGVSRFGEGSNGYLLLSDDDYGGDLGLLDDVDNMIAGKMFNGAVFEYYQYGGVPGSPILKLMENFLIVDVQGVDDSEISLKAGEGAQGDGWLGEIMINPTGSSFLISTEVGSTAKAQMWTSIDEAGCYLFHTLDAGGGNVQLQVGANTGAFQVTDNRTVKTGLQNAADYSVGATDRSLIDKAHVEALIAASEVGAAEGDMSSITAIATTAYTFSEIYEEPCTLNSVITNTAPTVLSLTSNKIKTTTAGLYLVTFSVSGYNTTNTRDDLYAILGMTGETGGVVGSEFAFYSRATADRGGNSKTMTLMLSANDEIWIELKCGAESGSTIANTTVLSLTKLTGAKGDSGDGDVTGPASSLDGYYPQFNGTTGKIIKSSTALRENNGRVIVNEAWTLPNSPSGVFSTPCIEVFGGTTATFLYNFFGFNWKFGFSSSGTGGVTTGIFSANSTIIANITSLYIPVSELTKGTSISATLAKVAAGSFIAINQFEDLATFEITAIASNASYYTFTVTNLSSTNITFTNTQRYMIGFTMGGSSGTVTSISTGTGLDHLYGDTTPYISLDLSELATMSEAIVPTSDYMIILDSGAERKRLISNIGLSNFLDDMSTTTATANKLAMRDASAELTAADFIQDSDIRKKDNIKNIESEGVNIEYKSFIFKDDTNQKLHCGVIAQELIKLRPQYVRENEEGMLSVSYSDLHSEEISGLKMKVNKLENRIEELESQITEILKMIKS